eukprot:6212911-Pleurochrysis_carterae.AAC.2
MLGLEGPSRLRVLRRSTRRCARPGERCTTPRAPRQIRIQSLVRAGLSSSARSRGRRDRNTRRTARGERNGESTGRTRTAETHAESGEDNIGTPSSVSGA